MRRDAYAIALASMGPRSADRGNASSRWPGSQAHVVASMGPRSADRGNAASCDCSRLQIALQWGRDQLIAEMRLAYRCAVDSQLLQWGRDQLIAEIATTRHSRHRCASASMGPRSADRGNESARSPCNSQLASMGPRSADRGNQRASERPAARWLQWGRDQLIAEISDVA